MVDRAEGFRSTNVLERTRLMVGGTGFAALAWAVESVVIVLMSVLTGTAYHGWMYGDAGDVAGFISVGCGTALLYALPFLFRDEYRLHEYLEGRRSVGRQALIWTYAFLCLGVAGFLTKTTNSYSRGWLVLFFFSGLAALVLSSGLLRRGLKMLLSADRIARRRLMLVGGAGEIARVTAEIAGLAKGARVVGTFSLPEAPAGGDAAKAPSLMTALSEAAAKARSLGVEDVVILTDWSRTKLIHEVVEAFRALPVGIHLGASSLVGPFTDARISRFAAMTAVSLTAPPLSPMQSFVKRSFDIIVSSLALVLLSPLFLAVAILIKTTSPGPVFFRQRRRGYNRVEFRIWKFRTMTCMDDGAHIEQARRNDARVTSIGKYLRRFSIDELPQLINVLAGDMSLVGPRPHAVAHDELFEKRIAEYSRRLNVRPGITGWAQVHGFRGITETDEAIRRRVQCDLYYIDNWSIALDLYIIAMTVLSPRTYTNAH